MNYVKTKLKNQETVLNIEARRMNNGAREFNSVTTHFNYEESRFNIVKSGFNSVKSGSVFEDIVMLTQETSYLFLATKCQAEPVEASSSSPFDKLRVTTNYNTKKIRSYGSGFRY